MRVVCIKGFTGPTETTIKPGAPIKGDILTVIGTNERYGNLFYVFIEMPADNGYLSDHFLPINENQQDETEMERSYGKQHA